MIRTHFATADLSPGHVIALPPSTNLILDSTIVLNPRTAVSAAPETRNHKWMQENWGMQPAWDSILQSDAECTWAAWPLWDYSGGWELEIPSIQNRSCMLLVHYDVYWFAISGIALSLAPLMAPDLIVTFA
jgi:hypothetical protein